VLSHLFLALTHPGVSWPHMAGGVGGVSGWSVTQETHSMDSAASGPF